MAEIKGSPELRDFIKGSEGFVENYGSYVDVTGKVTEGYGDTLNRGEPTRTREQAEARLEENIALFESELSSRITRDDLSQKQKDAIIDLAFNVGTDKIDNVIRRINERKDDEVADVLSQFVFAKDKDDGKRKPFPGLIKRANARREMWLEGMQQPTQSPEAQAPSLRDIPDSIFMKAARIAVGDVEAAEPSQQPQQGQYLPSDKNMRRAALLAAEASEPTPALPDGVDEIERADALARDVDPNQVKMIDKWSKQFSLDPQEAKIIVQHPRFQEAQARQRSVQIAERYPKLIDWAADPDNYSVLNLHPEDVLELTKTGSSWGDVKNALAMSAIDVSSAMAHTMMALGVVNQETGFSALDNLSELREGFPIIKNEARIGELSQAFSKIGTGIQRTIDAAKVEIPFSERERLLPAVWQTLREAGATTMDFLHALELSYENPEAFSLMAISSIGPSALARGVGAGTVSVTGLILGPVGALRAAALGAGATGTAIEFGVHVQNKIAESGLTPKQFYSDPQRLREVQTDALKRGLTIGIGDAYLSRIAGVDLAKKTAAVKAAKGVTETTKAVAGVGKAVVAGAAKEAAVEGVTEAAGGIAAGEDIGKALGEGITEGILSVPLGGVSTVGSAFIEAKNIERQTVRNIKIVESSKKAMSAMASHKAFSEIQEAWKNAAVSKEFPERAAQIIAETTSGDIPEIIPAAEPLTIETPTEIVQAEDREIENNVPQAEQAIAYDQSQVRIRHAEWEAYFKAQGISPVEAVSALNPIAAEEYVKAKREGRDFSVSMADFLREYGDNDELSKIVRFGDNELNALEGEALYSKIEEELPTLFMPADGEEPGDADATIQVADEAVDGEPVFRPVALTAPYKNVQEKELYKSLIRSMKSLVAKSPQIPKDMAEAIADIQFRHLRMRSEALGISSDELAKNLDFMVNPTIIKGDAVGQVSISKRVLERITNYKGYGEILLTLQGEKSTPVTVLHEFAHTWLYDMMFDWERIHAIEEDALTPGQREYREAMQTAAKLLGVKSLREELNRTEKEGVEGIRKIQEVFAQTAEKYFFEGKFANVRVKRLFEFFREWLRPFAAILGKTYKFFPSLNISPDVERVFSIITGVSNTVEEEVYRMFPEPMFSATELGKEGAKYVEAFRSARDEAIGDSYLKSFNRSIAERAKLRDKFLDQAFDRASQEIDQLPSVQIARALQVLPPEERISYASFVEMFGEDARKDMPKAVIAGQKKPGRHINDILLQLQISNPQDFLTLMREAANRDRLVSDRAEQLFEELNATTKSDEQIHDVVVEEINSDGREALLRKEMSILMERYKGAFKGATGKLILPASMQSRAAKENSIGQASSIVMGSKVKGFKPENFFRESARHGKDAAKYWKKNDIEAAIESKFHELVHFNSYRIAKGLSKNLAKSALLVNTIAKSSDTRIAKVYDVAAYNEARRIISDMNQNRLIRYIELPVNQVYTEAWVNQVNSRIDDLNRLIGQAGGVENIDVQTYLQFAEVLSNIKKAAYHQKNVEMAGRAESRAAMIDSVVEDIAKAPDAKTTQTKDNIIRQYVRGTERFREFLSSFYKTDVDFERSALGRLYNLVAQAEARMTTDFESAKAKLEGIIKQRVAQTDGGTYRRWVDPLIKRIPFFGKEILPQEAIHSPELNYTFKSIDEVRVALAYAGSESGTEKLLRGGGEDGVPFADWDIASGKIDDSGFWKFINRLIAEDKLVKADFDLVQSMWDMFAEHHDGAKSAYKHIYGHEFGTIQARPFTTPFGTYRGGYFPASRSATYIDLTTGIEQLDTENARKSFQELYPVTNMGFTQKRTQTYYPVSLDLRVFMTSIRSVLQLKHLKVPLYEAGKIMGSDAFIRTVESKRPGSWRAVVKPWFARVVAQQYVEPPEAGFIWMANTARVIRKNTQVAWYFGNIASALKQPLGLIPAASKVKPRYLAKGLERFMASPKKAIETIAAADPRMKARFEAGQRRSLRSFDDIELNGDWVAWSTSKIEHLTFLPIQMMQNMADIAVWYGAYEQAKADNPNMSDETAVNLATNAVEKTQSSTAISSRSAVQQTSDILKLVTDLSSYPLTMFNLNLEEFRRSAGEPAYIRLRRSLGLAMLTLALPSVMVAAARKAWGDLTKAEDDEQENDDWALQLAAEIFDGIMPVAGRSAIAIATGNPDRIAPALAFVGRTALRTGRAASDIASDIPILPGDLAAIFDAATIVSGLPFSVVSKSFRFYEEGKPKRQKRKESASRRRAQSRKRRDEKRRERR